MRDHKVTLTLESNDYELADPTAAIDLSQEAIYVGAWAKRLHLPGEVSDAQGRPLSQARISIGGFSAHSDVDGRFNLLLPADLTDRSIIITAPGFEPWRGQATPGGNGIRVRLTALSAGQVRNP